MSLQRRRWERGKKERRRRRERREGEEGRAVRGQEEREREREGTNDKGNKRKEAKEPDITVFKGQTKTWIDKCTRDMNHLGTLLALFFFFLMSPSFAFANSNINSCSLQRDHPPLSALDPSRTAMPRTGLIQMDLHLQNGHSLGQCPPPFKLSPPPWRAPRTRLKSLLLLPPSLLPTRFLPTMLHYISTKTNLTTYRWATVLLSYVHVQLRNGFFVSLDMKTIRN